MSSSLSSYPAAPPPPPPPPPPPSPPILGLGYIIAIGLAILVLLSSFLLASYLCLRRPRRRPHSPLPVTGGGGSVVLPRIIFVPEDDDDDGSGCVGLDAAVINSYPRFPYSKGGGVGDGTCAICLCEYREGEMMRMLPDCRHVFHLGCVDAWLKLNASCPVCRTSPLPTPLSTPLSELVPLSLYSNGRRQR